MLKQIVKKILSVACVACIASSGMNAFAKTIVPRLVYTKNEELEIAPDNDLFKNGKGLVPGDTMNQKIEIANFSANPIHLYMKAEPVEGQTKQAQKLLDTLIMKLTLDTKESGELVRYYGILSGKENKAGANLTQGEHGILLGTVSSHGEAHLTAMVKIPESMGNEIQNMKIKIKWIFYCDEEDFEEIPDSSTPLNPASKPKPSKPTKPSKPSPYVSKAKPKSQKRYYKKVKNNGEYEMIYDEDVPLLDAPGTGDKTNYALPAAIAGSSAGLIIIFVVSILRKKKTQ